MAAGGPFSTEARFSRSRVPARYRLSLAQVARKPSRRSVHIALSALLPPTLILSLLLLLSLLGLNFNHIDKDYGCDPNGNVWATPSHRPNLWSSKYGLAISLGLGKLAYTPVRVIDVAWDYLLARGVQMLAVYLIWRVFKGPMALEIKRSAVRYETVMKMQYDTAGLGSFFAYARDVFRTKASAYQYMIAVMLVLSVSYVLVAPTMVQAMTGYQPVTIPLLKLQNGTYLSFAELGRCSYIVQDGERLGLSSMACVPRTSPLADAISLYFTQYITYNYTGGWTADPRSVSDIQRSSILKVAGQPLRHLDAPLLNITQSHFKDPAHAAYFDGHSFSADYLTQHGYCAPQNTYVWGFSLILLFLFLCITFIFGILIYIVWILHLRNTYRAPDQSEQIFGDLRTAVTVVQYIQDGLGESVTSQLPESALKNALREQGGMLRLRERWRDGVRERDGSSFSIRHGQSNAARAVYLHSPEETRPKSEVATFWKELGESPAHSLDEKGFI